MIVSPYKNSTNLQPAAPFNLQAVFLKEGESMNNELVHTVAAGYLSITTDVIAVTSLQKDEIDELLLGAATALFMTYRSAYDDDAEFVDFLHHLNDLAEEHVKECKAGEQNDLQKQD